MDFFTEMKRSLESTGKQVAKKTKDFSESLQLKSKIAAEKDALETMYRSIGRQVYEHATEEEAERFAEEFLSIQKTLKRKAELEEELAALEGAVYYEECGAKLDRNAVFCSRCGSRVQAWRDDKLSSRFDRLLGLLNGQDCPRAHRKVGHLLFHFPYCRGGSICPKSNFDQRDPAFQECPGHRHGVLFRPVQLCHRNNADPVDLLVHGTHVTIILSDV